jgi:tetratricopeptide (TPR) repeat protein
MSDGTADESIRLGHAARRAGRPRDALGHYRAAVEQEPDNPEANTACGLMLLDVGRAEEAEAPLRKAVSLAPSQAAFRMNLAQWLAYQGQLDEAVSLVAGVAADDPQSWLAWERLGDLQARLQRFDDALTHYGRAAQLRPTDPSILFKWARAHFDTGRSDDAERILKDAARLAPANEAIFRLYAEMFESQSRWVALGQVAESWTQAHPKSAPAWRVLARALSETGYLRQAMKSFRTSMDLGWRDAESLATYGRLCLTALEFDEAARALDEAEALDPDSGHMLSARATEMMFAGRYEEAQSYCRRSLSINPDDASAYRLLAQLSNGDLPEEDLAAMRRLADREDIGVQHRIAAAFGLGDCLDARAQVEPAFAAYELANRLAAEVAATQGSTYDREAREKQTTELISIFDSVPAGRPESSGPIPVFIVGMPRSGTTLVESVIGAHSRVLAGGERMAMRWIIEDFVARVRAAPDAAIKDEIWKQWREFYWNDMPGSAAAAAVTDKNPWNFDAIGLILRLFPQARIIHVRRNPVETGLSIFRNSFSRFMPFTTRLADIGHYYGEYARLMAHWARVAGKRVITVQYEDVVGQFDVNGPALLAAAGLDWEESCQSYWTSDRIISTMSTMQARRPPAAGPGRAVQYAAHLAPLEDALRASRVDLRTGALNAGGA